MAKSRVDAWELAWRSCEAQMSAIMSADSKLHASNLEQAVSNLKEIQDDQAQIVDLERRTIAILEHKPFGLPLTASEREELAALKEDIQKLKVAAPESPVVKTATLATTVFPTDGSAPINAGTSVELLSQDATYARIRYAGREYIVPNSMITGN